IRNSNIKSEVIIITGHGDMEKAVKALDLSASDFINKPVERQALNSALTRAKKRINQAKIEKFTLTEKQTDDLIDIKIKGQLSSFANDSLSKLLNSEQFNKVNKARIIFDDSFSINKGGISTLINFAKGIKDKNISVVMEGLSYNYIRFFEMAGINKIANLVEEKTDE
ncbi:MAG: response regulator, partial [Desulfobacteraceae bacterium]|nr:response regulator [Desulfobacteraceae bacterium]